MPRQRMVWAFDLYEEQAEGALSQARLAAAIASVFDWDVEPVYVKNPSGEVFSEKANLDYKAAIRKALGEVEKSVRIPNLLPPFLLWERFDSRKAQIKLLLEYADGIQSPLILTGTHGRSGFDRFVLGSFAETLLSHSNIPVVTVHPESQFQSVKRIIFPTELIPQNIADLEKVIPLCQSFRADLSIFHKKPWFYGELMDPQTEEERFQEVSTEWKHRAEQSGIETSLVVDSSSDLVEEAIVREGRAHENSLMVMVSHHAGLSSFFSGHLSRNVVRQSPIPVWVIPKASQSKEVEHPSEANLG